MGLPTALRFSMIAAIIMFAVCRSFVTAAELCQDCSTRRAMLTDAEITEIRIEHIKQQILKKLRLTEPPTPNVEPLTLPEPLRLSSQQAKSIDYEEQADDDDDFYGKLEQVVLFPSDGGSWCDPSANMSTICLLFRLPAEVNGFSLKSAEFWLYNEHSNKSIVDEFVISQVADINVNRNGSATEVSTQRIHLKDGWGKADVSEMVKEWQKAENVADSFHNIYVSCPTCANGTRPPVSLEINRKPFLTISVDYSNKSKRRKRSVKCAPGIEECCKDNLNISFADLSWDKWIVSPATYNAYQCKGTCQPLSSVTNGNYYHSVVKQYNQQNPNEQVVSCCTPQKFSGLEIIYLDQQGFIRKQILPNMVVESCGCV